MPYNNKLKSTVKCRVVACDAAEIANARRSFRYKIESVIAADRGRIE